ncbi:MAG: hypothetical protein OXB92_02450 [Acidimicrobiaceae bacterium]|nr:hypothetical protein [Acidimicrobiaceae bacterium]
MSRIIKTVSIWLPVILLVAVLTTTPTAAEDSASVDQHQAEMTFNEVLPKIPEIRSLLERTAADSSGLVIDQTENAENLILMTSPNGDTLKIPENNNHTVDMLRNDGFELSVEIPGGGSQAKVASDGSAIFENIADDTDLFVQAQKDTGVRMIVLIAGADAPTTVDFEYTVSGNEKAVLAQDGSAAIVDSDNFVISLIEAPWAFDALGNKIPAEYTVQGDTLVLNVAHGMAAAYPVLADPVWTWGLVSGTAYFSRNETKAVAGNIATLSRYLILTPPPFNVLIAAYSVTIFGWAVSALWQKNKCLKVKFGLTWSWSGPSPGITPGHYICR